VFLERFTRELASGPHAALIRDQTGWHVSRPLAVPENVPLVPLPAYSPSLPLQPSLPCQTVSWGMCDGDEGRGGGLG
jgi:hypothetical protein